jgi:Cu+-exporting ATPase
MATDPICGMYVDELTADLKLVRDNRTYYFCATSCMEAFAEPAKELERLKWRLYVAAPLSAIVLILTYVYQAPYWPYAALVLASIVQFYPGYHFYRGTWDAIKNRIANMDVLIAVGTTVAYLYSAVALLVPGRLPAIYYFDASAVIITLILTGSYLEHLTRERARGTLRKLHELLPSTATVIRGGKEVEVPMAEVMAEESVIVRPGGRIPADGVVLEGTSSIDESLVTGESMPVEKRMGSTVLAGTMNGEGRLVVRTTNVGENTVLSQIGSLLTEAETSRVPIQQLADRIASVFVPVVLVIAISAGLGWALLGHAPFNSSLLIFVTVAITACPCAFGLATPAAIVMGTGRAAQEGILFKGKDTIEKAASVDTVLTDKTGTLTVGRPALTDVVPAAGNGANELLSISASVESGSEHPLAKAVVEGARASGIAILPAQDVVSLPGRGVKGRVGKSEVTVLNGNAAREEGHSLGAVERSTEMLSGEGKAWSVVLRDGTPVGVLGFFDEPAPGAKEAVAALKADGISVAMVTGDNKAAADRVATQLGIGEVYASTDPKGKMEILRKKQAEGRHVAFVGDGINDAPSLIAADVGIAIGAGNEVAKEAGGVVLMRSDFRGAALALRISRRTIRRVRANLFWALGYNAVLLPIAAGILIPVFGFGLYNFLPMLGAAAMGLSSTTVLLNSFSLKWTSIG